MKALLSKVGRALLAVVHDRQVQRSGKAALALALARLLIVLGASPELVALAKQLVGLL